MSAKHLSTALVQVAISVLLICLFALPASAVKKARESWVNGGWQLWIEATDFDRRHTDKIIATGKEAKELAEKAPRPWLGGDLIFGLHMDGYVEYDFANPGDGGAYIYCRAMNFVHGRAYSQSWFIALNGDDPENRGLVIDTNPEWQWRSGRIGALSPTRLKKGVNTIRVISTGSGARGRNLNGHPCGFNRAV